MADSNGAVTRRSQIALITGAASGLGRQLALILAGDGMAIAAIDLQTEGLESLGKELRSQGRQYAWEIADVTDATTLKQAVSGLEERLGPVDLLVASAGIGAETPGQGFDAAAFAGIIEVNLLGVSNSIAAVLPAMLARRRGHLVAISSLASYRGLPSMAGYCASKAGVNSLMEALRIEVRPLGIDTTIVCPGWIRTPMTERLALQIPDMLDVNDAAKRIARAIRRRRDFVAFPGRSRWPLALISRLPAQVSDWFIRRSLQSVRKR